MIDKDTTKSIVSRILGSKEFQNADKYIDLLKYLIKTAEKGIIPKEKEIAREALGKGDDFDPMIDTSVRVYIYRLRKKLEDYYKNEGRNDPIEIFIPKGKYHLEFQERTHTRAHSWTECINTPFITLAVLFLLSLAALAYFWHRDSSSRNSLRVIHKNDEIWASLLNNELPVLIVLGDHFFFASRENEDNATEKYIRYHEVNSIDDLEKFIRQNKNPDIRYFKDDNYFLDRYCSWSLMDVLPIFYGYRKNVTLKLASEVTWNDFKNNNILFVGSFKTLGIMQSLFTSLHIQYELFPLPNRIVIRDSLAGPAEVFLTSVSKTPPLFQREYSYIAKIPGPNSNVIFLLCGFNYIGVENAVKIITNPNLLEKCKARLEKNLQEIPPFFEMVYQVEGFERTTMYSNPIACFRIPSDYNITQP